MSSCIIKFEGALNVQTRESHQDYENCEICEICKKCPSVRITPVGELKASCLACIAEMRQQIQEQIDWELENEE